MVFSSNPGYTLDIPTGAINFFNLKNAVGIPKQVLAGPEGFEPPLTVLETAVLAINTKGLRTIILLLILII